MEEFRVYIVDCYNYEFDTSPLEWEDEKFISEAEIQNNVCSLLDFQDVFNLGDVDMNNCFIRVL